MFDNLTKSISNVFSKLRDKKVLSEKDIEDTLIGIKEALLSADVSLEAADKFLEEAKKRAIGKERLENVDPANQFVADVHDTLVSMIGEGESGLKLEPVEKTTVTLLFGLQGSGKTTTSAKLAKYYKDKRRVFLVGLDVHRPAAMEQLAVLAKEVGVPCHIDTKEKKPYKILKRAMSIAKKEQYNMIIVDTAGRLEIDEEMMLELRRVVNSVDVTEKLLVVDSTAGQSVFDVAKSFQSNIGINGVILTKFDSGVRGGAALSLRYATGSSVKFIGTGEHLEDIDVFDAKRVAGQILGMGDIVKLVEKARAAISEKEAQEMLQKVIENNFDYNDFLKQIDATTKMGGISKMTSMIPGMANIDNELISREEQKFVKYKAIIQSMTKKERLALFPLNNSRKMRIANGSGQSIYDVNQLIKQFTMMKNMMGSTKKMNKLAKSLEGIGMSIEDLNKLM